jgi:O-antigen/teichoic acid export membrane protein
VTQQFSGINNAFNFSSTFLSQNGIDASTVTIVAVLMNVGNVLITVLSASLMDLAGRKPLILGSALGMSASIVALTVALTHPGQSWTAPFAVFSVVSFVMCFGVGMGPIPWLLPAELFPPDKVAAGSSFNALCNWGANFIVGLIFGIGLMFAGMLLPLFGRILSKGQSVAPIVQFSVNLLLPISTLVAVISYFFNAPIMHYLYHNVSEIDIQVFTCLMLAFPAFSLSNVYSTLLTSNGDLKTLNWIAFGGVVLNIGLNFLLIPVYQSLGAAIAALITQSFLALLFL